jgi:hypothetical protein
VQPTQLLSGNLMEEREFFRPKKQNAPINIELSGRTFLQELMYHKIKLCQEKFCKI